MTLGRAESGLPQGVLTDGPRLESNRTLGLAASIERLQEVLSFKSDSSVLSCTSHPEPGLRSRRHRLRWRLSRERHRKPHLALSCIEYCVQA
jgi:hypothetical protein